MPNLKLPSQDTNPQGATFPAIEASGPRWAYVKKSALRSDNPDLEVSYFELARIVLGAPLEAPARKSPDGLTYAVWIGDGVPAEEPAFTVPLEALPPTWAFVARSVLDARAPHGISAPNYIRLALDYFEKSDRTPVRVGSTHVAVWLHEDCEPSSDEPAWPKKG